MKPHPVAAGCSTEWSDRSRGCRARPGADRWGATGRGETDRGVRPGLEGIECLLEGVGAVPLPVNPKVAARAAI